MTSQPDSPGLFIRQVRRQRGLTLSAAAARMDLSIASLSRLERDERSFQRKDIEAAVDAFGFTPWEEFHLYMLSGVLPTTGPQISEEAFIRIGIEYLAQISLPALIVDRFGYYVAWNDAIQSMWQLPLDRTEHSLNALFSQAVRAKLGDAWRPYTLRLILMFYLRSLPVAREEQFHRVIDELVALHGDPFIEIWNAAQRLAMGDGESEPGGLSAIEQYETPVGKIDYAFSSALARSPTMMEVYVFIPFGTRSVALQRQFEEVVPAGVVHVSPALKSHQVGA